MADGLIGPGWEGHALGEIAEGCERGWRVDVGLAAEGIMAVEIEIAGDGWPAVGVGFAHELVNQRARSNLPPLEGEVAEQHAAHAMERGGGAAGRAAKRAQAMDDVGMEVATPLDLLRVFIGDGETEFVF